MMPAKMMSETPLPIPYSVMSSPNHMIITVPAVKVRMISRRGNQSSAGRMAGVVFWNSTVNPYAWPAPSATVR